MGSCQGCNAELSEGDAGCPQCGRRFAEGPPWKVAFKSRLAFRGYLEKNLARHKMVLPRRDTVATDVCVLIQLGLPDNAGEMALTGKVVGVVERPSRAQAPFDVQLEVLDLDAEKEELLRRVASGGRPPAASF